MCALFFERSGEITAKESRFPFSGEYLSVMRSAGVTRGEILFSLKTFLAALLALAVAFFWNLKQPYWALLTVLIVAQPYTGMVRSKSLYRFAGTFVGAGMAVFLVPRLVDLPTLLVLALALWVALCLYLSLIDATPRAYAFILSGYTAALIGFPSVAHPGQIFFVALSRVEEVCLGILATFLVNELFFPRSAVGFYARKIRHLKDQVEGAAETIFGEIPGREVLEGIRTRLYVDLFALGPLALFASYDSSNPVALKRMDLLRTRLAHLLPLVSEIVRLRERIALTDFRYRERAQNALSAAKGFVGQERDRDGHVPLPSELSASLHWAMEGGGEDDLLYDTLLIRLREFCILLSECRALSRGEGESLPSPPAPPPHRDHDMAALSSVGIFFTILFVSLFWILTAWPDGATATMMAAVASSFFAAMDDPAPAILRFLGFITAGSAVGIFLLYALLPMAQNFLELSLCLAIVLIPAGIFLSRPDAAIHVLAFSIGFGGLLALSSTYHADFAASVNTALAQSAGIGMAAVLTRILRSVGVLFSVRRLFRADLRDLASLASPDGEAHRNLFSPFLSRTPHLGIRLPALPPRERERYADGFLHAGLARTLLRLDREGASLSGEARGELEGFRRSLSALFTGKASGKRLSASLRLGVESERRRLVDLFRERSPETARLLSEVGILLPLPGADFSGRIAKGGTL